MSSLVSIRSIRSWKKAVTRRTVTGGKKARRLGPAEIAAARQDLIKRIKAEIAGGTYETDERLDVVADRILDKLMPL